MTLIKTGFSPQTREGKNSWMTLVGYNAQLIDYEH